MVYREFFGKPNSHKCHELLHTVYTDEVILYKDAFGIRSVFAI